MSSWPSSRTRGRSSCGHDAPLIPWPRLARSGRLALAELAAGRTSEILVRDVSSRFHRWNQFDRKQAPGFAKLRAQTNVSIAAPPVPATAACAHQYSINVPGFGMPKSVLFFRTSISSPEPAPWKMSNSPCSMGKKCPPEHGMIARKSC